MPSKPTKAIKAMFRSPSSWRIVRGDTVQVRGQQSSFGSVTTRQWTVPPSPCTICCWFTAGVQVMAGKDKGKQGEVLRVVRDQRVPRVFVAGVNMVSTLQ